MKLIIQIIQIFSPKLVSRIAYKFMSNPRIRKLRDSEERVLSKSIMDKITYKNFQIQKYRWGNQNHKTALLIHGWEGQGFTKLFEQVGMSLKISKPLKTQDNLNIQLVSNNSQTNLWAKLFEMSFGYKIPEEILLETKNEIDYYIAYTQNQAVGTAISYRTNNIMGIHSVGIPPEIRRKGYAEQIMKLLINSAAEDNCDYMTLQASDMGENLYLSLGFKEQFIIKNYKLQ